MCVRCHKSLVSTAAWYHIYLLTSYLSSHIMSIISRRISHNVYLLPWCLSSQIISIFLHPIFLLISIFSHHVYFLPSCLSSPIMSHIITISSHDIYLLTSYGVARLFGSLKLQVSFAKDPYKRDYIMQKRPMNLRSLLIEATPYVSSHIVCIFSHHVYLLTLSCSTPPPSILLLSADVCRMSESRVYSAAWCYVCRVLEKSIVYCVCGRCV